MVGWYATKYKISRSRNGTQARCGQLPLEGLKRPIIGVNLSKVWNCPRIVCGSVLPFTINMDWILEIVLWFSLLSWWSCCSRMKKRTNWKMRPLPLKSQPAWQATKCWNQDWDTDLKYLRQSNFVLKDQYFKQQALSHKSIWNASVGMRSSFYQKFWEGTH